MFFKVHEVYIKVFHVIVIKDIPYFEGTLQNRRCENLINDVHKQWNHFKNILIIFQVFYLFIIYLFTFCKDNILNARTQMIKHTCIYTFLFICRFLRIKAPNKKKMYKKI